jgi:PAS domain S-box-containing protein
MTDHPGILVVDDDADSRSLVTDILVSARYHVRAADGGTLALASVGAWLPELILLDIRMAGMDGLEVCRRLKADERSRSVPVIFITAATYAEDRVDGLAVGAVDYISKPFHPEELLARVRTHLELSRLRKDLEQQVSDRTAELSRAVDHLRESEARLKDAERMTHVGHWTWNIKTNRASWSDEVFRIMGQAEDYEPDYEAFLERIVYSGDRDRLEKWVSDCLGEKRGGVIEYRIVRPSGEMRTVVFTSEVRFGEDGSSKRIFGTFQDVTDARRAQEESFARQKLESLGTLASGIAHDFNNLLGAVLAQAESAAAGLADGSDPSEELERIKEVAVRGSDIVRQLMIYAGNESDVLEFVDISEVIEGMSGLLKSAISRRVALVTDLGKDLPAIKAHAPQICQVVMNLVVNASDAIGDSNGKIRISTRRVTLGPNYAGVRAEALAEGDYIQLAVSDTGSGLTPEIQAQIFDPFFSTKSAGRGLGLPVIHGIVRRLRGGIRVESEVGKGTTFEILLPSEGNSARLSHDTTTGMEQKFHQSSEAHGTYRGR